MVMTLNAIRYTLGCLADVAFPQGDFSVEVSPEPTIIVNGCISIKFPVPTDDNVNLLLNGSVCYSEIYSYDNKVKVKVFGLAEGKDLFTLEDGAVSVMPTCFRCRLLCFHIMRKHAWISVISTVDLLIAIV